MPNWKKVIVSGSSPHFNHITASGDVSGSAISTASFGTYIGDGSNLTNLNTTTPTLAQVVTAGASATGDVQITGSLTISGSFHSFTLDSDNIVLGSGSGVAMEADADNNVIVGVNAGNSITTGDGAVIIGKSAGQTYTTGNLNAVLIGTSAGQNLTSAYGHTAIAIGNNALNSPGNGASGTIAIGDSAAYSNTGTHVVAIGTRAAYGAGQPQGGSVAIGYSAMHTQGHANSVAIGKNALYSAVNGGVHTTAVGMSAGYGITSGDGNTLYGYYAGYSLASSDTGNIIIGSGSLGASGISNQLRIGNDDIVTISGSLATGDVIFYNTASAPNFSGSFQGDGSNLTNLNTTTPTLAQVVTAGASATGDVQITGSLTVSGSLLVDFNDNDNIFISTPGSSSGDNNLTTGTHNLVIGMNAGENLTDSNNNVILGHEAASGSQFASAKGNNIVVGYRSGLNANPTNYGENIFIGSEAGRDSKGNRSVFIGGGSGTNAEGLYNTAIGYATMQGNTYTTTPNYNTVIGYEAGKNLWDGDNNVAIGTQALAAGDSFKLLTNNIAIGPNSLDNAECIEYSIAIGTHALGSAHNNNYPASNPQGAGYNIAIGNYAGFSEDRGKQHIFIGEYAGYNVTNSTGSIIIGSGSKGETTLNHQLRIGNADVIAISGSLVTGDIIFYNTASAPNFSGSFQGDGSNLTNLNTTTPTLAQVVTAGASATGDVQITGSLIISQSYTAGDTDSTALRLFGSGSVSQSGIFEVEGSAGPLFSVADGLDGVLMEVNNISGLPLFQVSSSNEVFVNRGNLTSGVTTATASFANFSGSFQGDGSQLTNLNVNASSITTAFTNITSSGDISASGQIIGTGLTASALTAGEVVFVGTGGALASNAGMTYNAANTQLTVTNLNVVHLTSSFITSSRIYTSGSNIFGDDTTDTQTLIGTTIMSGSAQITGSLTGTPGTTNNLTASYAITASHALSSLTATTATTASFALTSSLVIQQDATNKVVNTRNINFTGNAVALTTSAPNPGASVIVAINTGSISTPTLQEVTTQGSSTTIPITASILSATASNAYGVGPADSLTVKGGDGIHAGGINGGNLNLQGGDSLLGASGTRKGGNVIIRGGEGATSSGSISITGDTSITGSFTIEKSGSTVFEVIGSEGTLFTVDDDLDGTIFTANDRSGLPVLEASASGEVYIGKAPQSLYTTAVISSTTANISQSIYGLSTSSYGGVFVDYTANSGSNARAGSIVSVWSGSSINFTETTTLDIGNTSNLLMQVAISQSQAQVQSYATTAGYNIKTIIRSI